MKELGPLRVEHLFRPLLDELLGLLEGLSEEDWKAPTRAGRWRVRDVAAHLLDGDVRRLSLQRHGYQAPPPDRDIDSYRSLVDYLNHLNAVWVSAFQRASPEVILEMQRVIGPQVCDLFEGLDPNGEAPFGVAWAGEERSTNAFDLAREYTEKWHHQQQIREGVGAPLLDSPEWVGPALDTFVRGLPYAYRDVSAEIGATVVLTVNGAVTASWALEREDFCWTLREGLSPSATVRATMSSDTAWRLFSKMGIAGQPHEQIRVEGSEALAGPLLSFVGFMV